MLGCARYCSASSRRVFSGLWYWPILLMVLVSAINLIGAGDDNQKALRCALFTTILLIGTVFLSTVLQHLFKSHSQTQELGVRFEGWCGLPKMNQASPREAGHKPAF